MSPANGSVLIVDDDLDTADALAEALRRRGLAASGVGSARACLDRLTHEAVDVVVTDVQMPGTSGIELCHELTERHPDLLPIVITGGSSLELAIKAIRAGAYDFITKPVAVDALELAVARALAHLQLRREVVRLRVDPRESAIEGIAGSSRAIRETLELVHRVAASDATVLIRGESGTGKELVAKALHQLSPRRNQPFVAVNCAAMPAPLLESELFGHVRGAFTDAQSARPGLFAQAGRGTMFLDELGEMPIEMQVKILRVLQERMVRPVGGDTELRFDARIIASTSRELDVEVQEKRFREDLFYRINVVEIVVPSLRARFGDVLLLAHHFLHRIAARISKPVRGITPPAARLLVSYNWPGNVRELENCMERAVALCRLDQITIDDLPSKLSDHERDHFVLREDSPREMVTLYEMEQRYTRQVLSAVGGNKTHAARILGIDRRSIYRRLDEQDDTSIRAKRASERRAAT
jgi:two-component system, NtrC family, response regulator AtoC